MLSQQMFVELLGEEIAALMSKVSSFRADHSDAVTVSKMIGLLRKDAVSIQSKVSDLAARSPSLFQEHQPTAASLRLSSQSLENVFALLMELEEANWKQRMQEAECHLQEMKHHDHLQIAELEKMNTEVLPSLMNFIIPSDPGDLCSSDVSLTKMKAELQALLSPDPATDNNGEIIEATQLQSDPMSCSPNHDVSVRTQIEVAQLTLQLELGRRCEKKLFENESVSNVAEATKLVESKSPPQMMSHYDVTASRSRQSSFLTQLDSINAQEGFKGYVRSTLQRVAQLKLVASISFELVPDGTYTLGSAAEASVTLLPIAGSIDKSSRLDRRTAFWLASDASSRVGKGVDYRDGPQHHFFRTPLRSVDLYGYWVSTTPLTIPQFLALSADRRIGKEIRGIIPPEYLSLSHRLIATPTFLNGKLQGYILDSVLRHEYDPLYLELPFRLAEALCTALGCVIPPVDVWEAGGVGVEQRSFLLDTETFHGLNIEKTGWRVEVDHGTRSVWGTSWRLHKSSQTVLHKIPTAFGHRAYCWCGCEWNTTDINSVKGASSNSTFENCFAVLRSGADLGTQTVFCGKTYSETSNESFLPDRNFLPRNEDNFVGMSFASFAVQSRGLPFGAVRLSFPATYDGSLQAQHSSIKRREQHGCALSFNDLCVALGRPWANVPWKGLQPTETYIDIISYTKNYVFGAAGFDATASENAPYVLQSITFYGTPVQIVQPALIDRRCFAHAIGENVQFTLPLYGPTLEETLAKFRRTGKILSDKDFEHLVCVDGTHFCLTMTSDVSLNGRYVSAVKCVTCTCNVQ